MSKGLELPLLLCRSPLWVGCPTSSCLSKQAPGFILQQKRSFPSHRSWLFPVTSSQKRLGTNPKAQIPFPFLFLSCFLLQSQTAAVTLKESKFIASKALMPPANTGWEIALCYGNLFFLYLNFVLDKERCLAEGSHLLQPLGPVPPASVDPVTGKFALAFVPRLVRS